MAIEKIIPIPPFKRWTLENFPFIEEDFDAITNYQLYCKIVEYLKKIAENQNQLDEIVNNLVSYVNNYFENLDVQEEINTKLDEMAESGELTEIIAQYLELAGVLAYNTISDMSAAENIAENSICYTLGQSLYNDGKGAFYKIRTMTSGDVVDGFNLVALDVSNTLVAERMTNYYINEILETIGDLSKLTTPNKNSVVEAINFSDYNQQLNLAPFMIYDTDDNHIGHFQGACIHNNTLYVTRQGDDSINGTIYKFNYSTQEALTPISNIPFYHGADIAWLDNKLYIPCAQNSTDKTFCVYDEINETSTTLTPFSALTDYRLIGVDKYNNKLLCWFDKTSDNRLLADKFELLDLTNNEYTEMTISDPNNILKFSDIDIVRQTMCVTGNELYILMDAPHVLLYGIIEGTTITFIKLYQLPYYDGLNQGVAELEGVCKIENDNFPNDSLMFTGRTLQTYENLNNAFDSDILTTYIINPKTGSTYEGYGIGSGGQMYANRHNYYTVKASATTLVETGASAYPFKKLIRGINAVNSALSNGGGIIYIRDSGNYYLPYLYNYKNLIIRVADSNTPSIYIDKIDSCKITFETEGNNSKIYIKAINTTTHRINIFNSDISFICASNNAIEFNEVQINSSNSKVTTRRCKVNNTINVSSGYVFTIDNNSIFIDGIATWTLHESNKYIQIGGNSVVFSASASAQVVKVGAGFVVSS